MSRDTFQAHIELLHFFLDHRDEIVERIQGVLNAQRKPIEYLQDGSLLARHFEDCFFTLTGVSNSQLRLRWQLDDAHVASGFMPREIAGLHNGLVDPAELMVRAFHLWQQTRWPGRNGRIRYAHTLFNVHVIRCLELLSMRLWDDGSTSASERLSQVQRVLDGCSSWRRAPRPRNWARTSTSQKELQTAFPNRTGLKSTKPAFEWLPGTCVHRFVITP